MQACRLHPEGMKMGSGCHPELVLNEVKDLRRICFSRRSVIEGEILHFVQNDKFWCRWFIFIPGEATRTRRTRDRRHESASVLSRLRTDQFPVTIRAAPFRIDKGHGLSTERTVGRLGGLAGRQDRKLKLQILFIHPKREGGVHWEDL